MLNVEYQALCRDTCVALRLDDPEVLQKQGEVEVDGVRIAVAFSEDEDPDCITCFVDLGRPDDDERTLVFERLLEMNVHNRLRTVGVFAFDSVSGHACSTLEVRDLRRLDGEFLAELLRFYARESLSARELVRSPWEHVARRSMPGMPGGLISDLA